MTEQQQGAKPKAPPSRQTTELIVTDDQGEHEAMAMLPPAQQPTGLAPGSTDGLSTLRLTAAEMQSLTRPLDPKTEVEVRPDGVVFMPTGLVRARLDETFGPGQWGLRQERDPFYDSQTNECCYDGSLWVRGKFISRAVGGCRWSPTNRQMNKTDAIEGAKSDCLRRCCKDIGIGRELWTPSWIREFLATSVEPYAGTTWDGKPKTFYRKTGVAMFGEALDRATSIFNEFPLAFGPDTKIPGGKYEGQPLKDVPEDALLEFAKNAKGTEWKLACKAEVVRRQRDAAKKKEPATVEDVLPAEEKTE